MKVLALRRIDRFVPRLATGMSLAIVPLVAQAEESPPVEPRPTPVQIRLEQRPDTDSGQVVEDVLIQVPPGAELGATPVIEPLGNGVRARINWVQDGAADQRQGRELILTRPNPPDGPQSLGVTVKLSDYWLGLECLPASDAMRAQLGLQPGQGLVVAQVFPDSPAAKSGVQSHDVLVTAGDKPLTDVESLVKAIDEAKDSELVLSLMRAGKSQSLTVKPAKRPQQDLLVFTPKGVNNLPGVINLLEPHPFRPGQARPGEELRLDIVAPGAFLTTIEPLSIPENTSIRLHREGGQPTRIDIEQGTDKWSVSEQELDKLPEKLREVVWRMLRALAGGGPPHLQLQGRIMNPNQGPPAAGSLTIQPGVAPQGANPALPAGPGGPNWGNAFGPHRRAIEDLHRQLEGVQQQLKQLHDELQQLRESQPK